MVTQPAAGEFRAFSATCTHQGCAVGDVTDGTINCPCHGSKFAVADGAVVDGPARRPAARAQHRGERRTRSSSPDVHAAVGHWFDAKCRPRPRPRSHCPPGRPGGRIAARGGGRCGTAWTPRRSTPPTARSRRGARREGAPRSPEELALAAEFPTPDRADWLALVDQVVRRLADPDDAPHGGASRSSIWTTPDGIRVRPLYTARRRPRPGDGRRAGRGPVRRGAARRPLPGRLGRAAAPRRTRPRRPPGRDRSPTCENGVTSIWLAVGEGGTAVADLPAVLDGVHLDLAPVVLDAGRRQRGHGGRRGVPRPRGERGVRAGGPARHARPRPARACAPAPATGPSVDAVVPLARRVAAEFPRVRAVVVDAMPVHGAGASDAQELGWSLAAGVAYLRVAHRRRARPRRRPRACWSSATRRPSSSSRRSRSCARRGGCGRG